jgi:hypothetical protein
MNWRKGHNPLTVFFKLISKRVLKTTPGKMASFWDGLAAEAVEARSPRTPVCRILGGILLIIAGKLILLSFYSTACNRVQ